MSEPKLFGIPVKVVHFASRLWRSQSMTTRVLNSCLRKIVGSTGFEDADMLHYQKTSLAKEFTFKKRDGGGLHE
jgi:hypothetical protein